MRVPGWQSGSDADQRHVVGVRDIEIERMFSREFGTAADAAPQRNRRGIDAESNTS